MNSDMYEEKNNRMHESLKEKQPYWLLISQDSTGREDWYNALIQIRNDRSPVKVVLEKMFGVEYSEWIHANESIEKVIGYAPEGIFNRYLLIDSNKSSLLNDIVEAMLDSIRNDPDSKGFWGMKDDGTWWVQTYYCRDSSKSFTGGDYNYYREYSVCSAGISVINSSSADYVLSDLRPVLYRVKIEDITNIFNYAAEVVRKLLEGSKTVVCPCCGHPYTHNVIEH